MLKVQVYVSTQIYFEDSYEYRECCMMSMYYVIKSKCDKTCLLLIDRNNDSYVRNNINTDFTKIRINNNNQIQ